MKGVLAWVKSNIVTVVLCAVMLIIPPGAWFATSKWNAGIRSAQEKSATEALGKVTRANVAYSELALTPGQEAFSITSAPNEALIEWFRSRRAEQAAQLDAIVKVAGERNRRRHAVLVEGLFPEPARGQEASKSLEMTGMFVPGHRRPELSAYERLLAGMRAGAPPVPKDVRAVLEDARARELERLRVDRGPQADQMTREEEQELAAKLVNQRLAEYRRRADEVSVFATLDIFPSEDGEGWPQVVRSMPPSPPSLGRCFAWQHDYWVVSDVFDAIGATNRDAEGRPTPVTESTVKRVLSVEMDPLPLFQGAGSYEPEGGTTNYTLPEVYDARTSLMPSKFERSITGRFSAEGNLLYDLRVVRLKVVASMDRLPQFLNELSRVNLLTVTDLDLLPVNVWADLSDGYYYGSEYVVRADLTIEAIYLRSWTEPLMPRSVKSALGIPVPETEAGGG